MAEERERATSDKYPLAVIDWSAVAGLAFEWVIAVGEYVFTVLLCGLVGGFFGQLVDGGLSFLHEPWVGLGRTWGWMFGAVIATIGLPLGWVRRDDRKFSFPSPRALRKRVSTRIGHERKNAPTAHEFRTVGDVVQGGGLLGLIGGVLGFLLGGALVMCWFSLAMSPFASAEWFESLEFGREPNFDNHSHRSGDGDGFVIRTDERISMYLWFVPIVVLGAVGTVVGTLYGAAQYARYTINVPADVRARHRAKKRQPVVEQREAVAAAIEQKLPVLASPPRRVPWRARWQLLRGGAGFGLVVGVLVSAVGGVFAAVLAAGVEIEGDDGPLAFFILAVVFLAVGLGTTVGCLRAWRQKTAILRRGYLARCQILECMDEESNRWKPYGAFVEELSAVWDKPIAEVAEFTEERSVQVFGVRWNRKTTDRDAKSFQRFATFAGCFAMLVFGFMGTMGVVMTCGFLYLAIWEGEEVAWFGLLFIALWWTIIVWIGRMFVHRVQLFKNIDKRSMKSSGIEPVIKCRAEFSLPSGKDVKFETKVDLSRELESGGPCDGEMIVYDSLDPKRVLLCRQFDPPLRVGENGRWQSA